MGDAPLNSRFPHAHDSVPAGTCVRENAVEVLSIAILNVPLGTTYRPESVIFGFLPSRLLLFRGAREHKKNDHFVQGKVFVRYEKPHKFCL